MTFHETIKWTFGVPLSISESDEPHDENILERLKAISDIVYDVNFTIRIEPFFTDAHGVYNDKRLLSKHIDDMLHLQSKTNVRVSALFNNIYVPPNLETLEIFINNFRPIYEKGIRSITQPHSLWMYYGRLKEEFPDLTVKDTVLRRTRNGMDFWNAAKLGFDYVNLDRLLLRNFKLLKDIKKAQLKFQKMYGKYVYLSILFGETCDGTCPFWEEHYQHTITHPKIVSEDPAENYAVHFKIAQCQEKPDFMLNRVHNSPFREDLDELAQYIDIIKYPGRRTEISLADAVFL